jgi:hypothetical protein
MDKGLRKETIRICRAIKLPIIYGLAEVEAMIEGAEVGGGWQVAHICNIASSDLRKWPTPETREHWLLLKFQRVSC